MLECPAYAEKFHDDKFVRKTYIEDKKSEAGDAAPEAEDE